MSERLTRTLLVVGNNRLCDSLADGVHLRSRATSADTDADVNLVEDVVSKNEEGLHNLGAEDLGSQEIEGNSVNLDKTTSSLACGNSGGGFLHNPR